MAHHMILLRQAKKTINKFIKLKKLLYGALHHKEAFLDPEKRDKNIYSDSGAVSKAIPNSSSCTSSTSAGHSVISSDIFCTFG